MSRWFSKQGVDVQTLLESLAPGNVWSVNLTISNTAPALVLTDTTASANSLTIAVDANLAQLRESVGASGSLLVLDLANNRVSIGTAAAASKFHILHSGSAVTAAADNPGYATIEGVNVPLSNTYGMLNIISNDALAADLGGSIGFGGRRTTDNQQYATFGVIKGGKNNSTTDDTGGYLAFATRSNGASAAERMRIDSAGNVGIGTTPSTLLHLLGADNTTVYTITINAAQASITAADTFIDFRSTTGSEGSVAGTGVAGVIAFTTFTGSHYTQVVDADRVLLKPGMLLEAIGNALGDFPKRTRLAKDGVTVEEFRASAKPQLVQSRICRTRGSKAAYGVYGGTDKEGRDLVLALGSGFCVVANKGANLEVGDYLMASDVVGATEKQPDDVYRNSTVAKAMQAITWLSNEMQRQVPCIYLGG